MRHRISGRGKSTSGRFWWQEYVGKFMNGARDEIFANCKQYLTVVSEVSFPSLRWFGLLQMFCWNDKLACSAGLFWCGRKFVLLQPPSYDGGRLGRVKIVTLRVGARAKGGKRGGGGEKKISLPAPSPAPFDSPHFLHSFRASTSRCREQNIRAPEENAFTAG